MTAATAAGAATRATARRARPAGARVLIVEDDFDIASNLHTFLSLKGFEVDAAYSGQAALHRCSIERFDVILLDIGLPGLDGLTFLQRLRDELRAATPVLVISARSELADKLAGFAHGADDYLTKPFALAEVEARVRALLNRSGAGSVVDPVLRFGTLELDRERGEARVAGNVVRLTPKATQLLELLLRKPGQLVRRAAIEARALARRAAAGRRPAQPDPLRCARRSPSTASTASRPCTASACAWSRAQRDGALMARRRSLAERVVWAVTGDGRAPGRPAVGARLRRRCTTQEDELSDTMLQREVQQIVAHTLQPGLTPTGMLIDSTRVSAWLTRDGVGGETMPAPMRALAPGLYHFDPTGKSLHVAVTDTDDGRLTVVLDATDAEERVDRFGYTLCALWLVCVAGDGLDRARRRRDRGRPDRRGDANDRQLGARPAAAGDGPQRRGRRADGDVQPLSRPRRRHGRARARVRRQPRPRDPHAADDDSHRRRADRPRGRPRAGSSASASSGSPRRSTRSSPPPSRRCRTAPAASSASRRSTCASSCSHAARGDGRSRRGERPAHRRRRRRRRA